MHCFRVEHGSPSAQNEHEAQTGQMNHAAGGNTLLTVAGWFFVELYALNFMFVTSIPLIVMKLLVLMTGSTSVALSSDYHSSLVCDCLRLRNTLLRRLKSNTDHLIIFKCTKELKFTLHSRGFGVLGFWGFGYWVVQKIFFLVFLYEKKPRRFI